MPKLVFVNRVCWPSIEATAQLLHDLTGELARRGWDCHVVAATAGPPREEIDHESSVTYHRAQHHASGRSTSLIAKALEHRRFKAHARNSLKRLLRPADIVVAMTDPPRLGETMVRITQTRQARLWHWAQDIYPEVALAILSPPWWQFVLKRQIPPRNQAWAQAERIITLAPDMAQLIRQQIGDQTPVEIIPNWYPHPATPPAHVDFRARWAVSPQDLLVLYAGNLGRAHSLLPLLDLAEHLQERTDIHFRFVGHGAQAPALRSAVQRRGLQQVKFSPPVAHAELDALLTAADAHLVTQRPACRGTVHPSKFHGIIASHRPAVFLGPPQGDIATEITTHGLGFATGPDQWLAAADYLRTLADSPTQRSETKRRVEAYAVRQDDARTVAALWDRHLRPPCSFAYLQ